MKSQKFLRDWYKEYNSPEGCNWGQRQMYDGHAPNHDTRMARIKELLSDRLQPTDRVLDLGCGNGLYTTWIAERVREAVGVEIDQGSLDTAEDGPNVHYVCASWDELPPDLGCFDWCLATEVLEHSLNPGRVVAGVDAKKWLVTVPLNEAVYPDPWEWEHYGHLHCFREAEVRELFDVEHYEEFSQFILAIGRRPVRGVV